MEDDFDEEEDAGKGVVEQKDIEEDSSNAISVELASSNSKILSKDTFNSHDSADIRTQI